NMISGFYRPDAGSITFEGRDITRAQPAEIAHIGIARTFQNIALFGGMTVLDNIMLGRHVRMKAGVLASFVYWGLAQREEVKHRARAEELIDFLELQDLRKQLTSSLSYGLRKRVELGRALALDPTLLLLDEPMGGMNQEEKEDMARYVIDVNEQWGTTIILIEHDMAVVMDISDRVAVRDLALGLAASGFGRGDKLSVIGENRPRLYFAQLAAMSLGGIAVPVYQDAIASELAYVLDHAEISVVVAEDQEQVDKILSLKERLPHLKLLVFDDPRGLLN